MNYYHYLFLNRLSKESQDFIRNLYKISSPADLFTSKERMVNSDIVKPLHAFGFIDLSRSSNGVVYDVKLTQRGAEICAVEHFLQGNNQGKTD